MRRLALLVVLFAAGGARAQAPADTQALARGEYVFHAAGCTSCHTDSQAKGALLAGGVALKSRYGTFYTPNITPDPDHGIGKWSEDDFRRALKQGVAPDGSNYFPAFPYASYTGMSDDDVHALWLYLRGIPPSAQADRPHELHFPYDLRVAVTAWKLLYFHPGEGDGQALPTQPADVARGAYLVTSVAHCGECHTPRNRFGGLIAGEWLGGSDDGPTGGTVPNITPDAKTGIGGWKTEDITALLNDGSTPDFDYVGGDMAEEVDNTTKYLTDDDRKAIAAYLKSVPPVVHQITKPSAK